MVVIVDNYIVYCKQLGPSQYVIQYKYNGSDKGPQEEVWNKTIYININCLRN